MKQQIKAMFVGVALISLLFMLSISQTNYNKIVYQDSDNNEQVLTAGVASYLEIEGPDEDKIHIARLEKENYQLKVKNEKLKKENDELKK